MKNKNMSKFVKKEIESWVSPLPLAYRLLLVCRHHNVWGGGGGGGAQQGGGHGGAGGSLPWGAVDADPSESKDMC